MAELNHHIFELEEDPACLGVLSRCAAEAGLMCREQAIAFLTSRKLHDEVDQEVIAARTRGITGVPYVVVNDKYGICGGLPAESYVEVNDRSTDLVQTFLYSFNILDVRKGLEARFSGTPVFIAYVSRRKGVACSFCIFSHS